MGHKLLVHQGETLYFQNPSQLWVIVQRVGFLVRHFSAFPTHLNVALLSFVVKLLFG